MPKYILPAVKHTLALLCVQVENEVCAVVYIAFLISERDMKKSCEVTMQREDVTIISRFYEPQNESSFDCGLHLLHKMFHIDLHKCV